MSVGEAARLFGVHQRTVRKILRFSIPPGHRQAKDLERSQPFAPVEGVVALFPAYLEAEVHKLASEEGGVRE
jgi:hypothetical protein